MHKAGSRARRWCVTIPNLVHSCPSYPTAVQARSDFSRDGKFAAYVRFTDGTLWRSKLDGTDRIQLRILLYR